MQTLKTEAYLLKRVNFSESDRVVVLYTREAGKVTAMARGARKSVKRFGGLLEHFVLFEAELDQPRHGGMSLLRTAAPRKALKKLLKDLDALSCGYRLLELVDFFEHDSHPAPPLFTLLERSLADLDSGCPPLEVRLGFEAGILKLAGLTPELARCVSCGREAPFAGPSLNFLHGGVCCGQCRLGGGQVSLSGPSWEALKRLFGGTGGPGPEAAVPLEGFLQYQIGKALKTAEVDQQMSRKA
jgi:DNA repair protein RecO (recombination protein O)